MNPSLRAIYPDLTEEDLAAIEWQMAGRSVRAGEVLIQEGSLSDALFLLQRGRASVQKEHLGARVTIAALEEGEVFGEISMLLQAAATASVVMDDEGEIRSIDGPDLRDLTASRPGMEARFYRSLARMLALRLARTSRVVLPSFNGG